MASVNERRLGRLEARTKPWWVPDPEREVGTSAVLKSMDAYMRDQDGKPPDLANEFTEAELAFDRKATRNFLPYLEGEWERADPDNREHLERYILWTKAEIAELDEEDEA